MSEPKDDAGNPALSIAKGTLMVLGGLVALGIVVSVLKPLIVVGAAAGVGYLGYRMLTRSKALSGGRDRKALPAGGDYDRRMRELEEIEKRLDAEIKR